MTFISLPPAQQLRLDQAAAKLGSGHALTDCRPLRALTAWLEEEGRITEAVCDQATWIHVFDSPQAQRAIDRRVEEMDDVPTSNELLAIAREVFAQGLTDDEEFWGWEYPVHVPIPVRTSRGEELVLGFVFETWAESPPGEWDGLFRSREAYVVWLRAQGYWTAMTEFDALGDEEKLAEFCGVWLEEEGDSSGNEGRDEEEAEEGDEDSLGDDASGGDRWYLKFRYYAVQEVQPIGEITWEHACDDEEEAYRAYFAQVAENYAKYGAPQSVLLLDCRERRVLSATGSVNDVNAAYEVRRWLGTG
jgi:hypothetical protein